MTVDVNVIAAIAITSRLADLLTTYLVSPTLKMEANWLARRFGWRFAWLTVLAGLIPYVSLTAGVVVLTASFMVAAANASKIVMARAIGEDEMLALSERILQATPLWPGIIYMTLPGVFVAALAGSLLYFYPSSTQWAYYFAVGLITYALAVFVWYPLRFLRMRARRD